MFKILNPTEIADWDDQVNGLPRLVILPRHRVGDGPERNPMV